MYNAAARVENAHFDAEHNYNRQSRESVYRFFAKSMLGNHPPSNLVDKEFFLPPEDVLLAFPKSGSRDIDGYAGVFRTWKTVATLQTLSGIDPAVQREAFRAIRPPRYALFMTRT